MTTSTNDNQYHMTTTTTWQPSTCPVQSTPVTITRFYFARKSSPHDNHHHMTTTTTWQSPPHICKCLLTTIVSDPAILLFDLIYIVTRCPRSVINDCFPYQGKVSQRNITRYLETVDSETKVFKPTTFPTLEETTCYYAFLEKLPYTNCGQEGVNSR